MACASIVGGKHRRVVWLHRNTDKGNGKNDFAADKPLAMAEDGCKIALLVLIFRYCSEE